MEIVLPVVRTVFHTYGNCVTSSSYGISYTWKWLYYRKFVRYFVHMEMIVLPVVPAVFLFDVHFSLILSHLQHVCVYVYVLAVVDCLKKYYFYYYRNRPTVFEMSNCVQPYYLTNVRKSREPAWNFVWQLLAHGRGKGFISLQWPPDQRWGPIPSRCSGRSVKPTAHLHLVPSLWMSGAVRHFPHISDWVNRDNSTFYLTCSVHYTNRYGNPNLYVLVSHLLCGLWMLKCVFLWCMLFVQVLYDIHRHAVMYYIIRNMCTTRQVAAYIYIAVACV
jgi:hypothetical protein